MKYVVIGDSHCSIFGKQDKILKITTNSDPSLSLNDFDIYHIGPVLATSLVERNSTLNARTRIFDIINKYDTNTNIIFVFSEIDCRFHIFNRCLKYNNLRQLKDSMKITIFRYLSFLIEIQLMKYIPIVYLPIASNPNIGNDIDFPTYGTCQDRNILIKNYINYLTPLLDDNSINYINIFNMLIDNSYITKTTFYFDNVHINQKTYNHIITQLENINEIRKTTKSTNHI